MYVMCDEKIKMAAHVAQEKMKPDSTFQWKTMQVDGRHAQQKLKLLACSQLQESEKNSW